MTPDSNAPGDIAAAINQVHVGQVKSYGSVYGSAYIGSESDSSGNTTKSINIDVTNIDFIKIDHEATGGNRPELRVTFGGKTVPLSTKKSDECVYVGDLSGNQTFTFYVSDFAGGEHYVYINVTQLLGYGITNS